MNLIAKATKCQNLVLTREFYCQGNKMSLSKYHIRIPHTSKHEDKIIGND